MVTIFSWDQKIDPDRVQSFMECAERVRLMMKWWTQYTRFIQKQNWHCLVLHRRTLLPKQKLKLKDQNQPTHPSHWYYLQVKSRKEYGCELRLNEERASSLDWLKSCARELINILKRNGSWNFQFGAYWSNRQGRRNSCWYSWIHLFDTGSKMFPFINTSIWLKTFDYTTISHLVKQEILHHVPEYLTT